MEQLQVSRKTKPYLNIKRVAWLRKLATHLKVDTALLTAIIVANDIPIYVQEQNNKLVLLVESAYVRLLLKQLQSFPDMEAVRDHLQRRAQLLADWCGLNPLIYAYQYQTVSALATAIVRQVVIKEMAMQSFCMPIVCVQNVARLRYVTEVLYE